MPAPADSFVETVEQYHRLPFPGDPGVLYYVRDRLRHYRWSDQRAAYVEHNRNP